MKKLTPRGSPPGRSEGNRYPDGRPTGPSRRPQRSTPERQQNLLLVGLIYGGIGLLALGVATVTFLMISPPTDLIRNRIVAEVAAETGREFKIAGPASFTFFPSVGMRVQDVSLSAPPGMGGEPLLTAQSLDVGVRLWPLVRREIAVDRLVLHKPVFNLRVDAQGRRSWDMAAAAAPVRYAEAATTLSDAPIRLAANEGGDGGRRLDVGELSLGDVRIIDGTVRYSDERSGTSREITAIDADVKTPSLASPVDAKGSFLSQSEKIAFDAKVTSLGDLMRERPAKLALNVAGRPLNVHYEGTIALQNDITADGSLSGDTTSLRTLAEWLGTRLPRSSGFGAASLAATLQGSGDSWRFSDAKLTLDGATATGTVGLITSGKRPHVVADLKVSGLNLDTYAARGSQGEKPAPVPPAEAAPPSTAPSEPRSIDDLLEPPGSKVKGFTQRDGWSGEAFDLTGLDLVDADAKLSISGLTYGGMHVDSSEVSLALTDRVLKTTLPDIRLYQGRGNGAVTVDGTGKEALVAADFSLANIAAQPLLKDSAGIDWLSGNYSGNLSIKGHGATEEALVQSLNGKADFAVSNGAVAGFNLGGAMRELRDGNIPDFEASPSQKTDFSALTGSLVITGGVARNEDLKLAGPALRATGSGSIDLPARSLDYTVKPTLVASTEGEGGAEDLAGIEVPVHVSGPWSAPKIEPDIEGAINSQKNVDAVKELGKQLKGKNAGEVINNLFGKGENGEPSKAEKFLDKLLGK
jgi:AsmA protein